MVVSEVTAGGSQSEAIAEVTGLAQVSQVQGETTRVLDSQSVT